MKKHLTLGIFTILLICSGCATSPSFLDTPARPEVDGKDVAFYSVRPANAETIGQVSAPNTISINGLHYGVRALKKEAGKLGANGVVIITDDMTALDNERAIGMAIYVPADTNRVRLQSTAIELH